MNAKDVGFLVVLLLMSVPLVHAQILTDEKAVQKSIYVTISSAQDVHVKHIISPSGSPRQVELVSGTIANLSVTDGQGQGVLYSVVGKNSGVLVMPTKGNAVIEYDLTGVISQIGEMWTWNFRYLETTTFEFSQDTDLIFINGGPLYLDDKKKINCHGCQAIIEYSTEEPRVHKSVERGGEKFDVEIRSHSEIGGLVFDRSAKSISFYVSEKDRYVTAMIPLELLDGPYTVLLEGEKIPFGRDSVGTHVWISAKPESTGTLTIMDRSEGEEPIELPESNTLRQEFWIILVGGIAGFSAILAVWAVKRLSRR